MRKITFALIILLFILVLLGCPVSSLPNEIVAPDNNTEDYQENNSAGLEKGVFHTVEIIPHAEYTEGFYYIAVKKPAEGEETGAIISVYTNKEHSSTSAPGTIILKATTSKLTATLKSEHSNNDVATTIKYDSEGNAGFWLEVTATPGQNHIEVRVSSPDIHVEAEVFKDLPSGSSKIHFELLAHDSLPLCNIKPKTSN